MKSSSTEARNLRHGTGVNGTLQFHLRDDGLGLAKKQLGNRSPTAVDRL